MADTNLPVGAQVIELKPGTTLADAEKLLIIATLNHTGQNRTRAAKLLGVCIRTLRVKLKKYRDAGEWCPSHGQESDEEKAAA